MVPAVGASGCGCRKSVSASPLHCQVAASAASCSPISRLARRIEGGMIDTSASWFSSASSKSCLAPAARQAEARVRLRADRADGRSQFRVQRSRASASWTSPRPIAAFQPPRMSVTADGQGRVGNLKQAEVHESLPSSEQEVALGHRQLVERLAADTFSPSTQTW